jgi:hypothetical protein
VVHGANHRARQLVKTGPLRPVYAAQSELISALKAQVGYQCVTLLH